MRRQMVMADSSAKEKFNIKSFLNLIKQTKPKYWQLWIGLFLGILATGAQLMVPKIAQTLINGFNQGVNQTLLYSVIGLFLASAVISTFSGSLLGIFGENVVANLRSKLWHSLVRLPVSYFDNVKTGEMTSRLVNDSTQVKDLLANSFPQMITSLIQLFGALLIMVFMDWKMTGIMVLAIPIILLVMLPIMKKSAKIGKHRQDELASFSGVAEETLNEIRLVKSSNAEIHETTRGNNKIKKLYKIGLKEAIYDSVSGPIMTLSMMALFVGVLVYASVRVAQGTMTMGTLVSFLMYLFQIIGPVGILGQFFTTLSKANGSTQRIRTLLDEPQEQLEVGQQKSIANKTLKMENVSFSYDNDKKEVLNKISFSAKPNSVIAFAGPSGGGKSTIFSLLERYYQPSSGKITIGDENINEISLMDWRSQIGYVSQDSAIMAGTIRDNLTYGSSQEYTDDELWTVLKLASADDFVQEMDKKLNTEVGERGIKVSGGQKQRLAIARAFLRDPKILMLDEATASLDSESESKVQAALDKLMKNRTTLVIAHRLSTILDADTIYFVDHGQISGSGSHKELMEKVPLYREYVKIQFKE